jgi:hypothetical protein
VHAYLKTSSVWIGTIIIPIEKSVILWQTPYPLLHLICQNRNYNTLVFWFEHQVS